MDSAPTTASDAPAAQNAADAAATAEYMNSLPAHHVAPLWTVMGAMVPPRPAPKTAVATWRYEDVRPLLLRAGELVRASEAERRVLMLVNPGLRAPYTTDTLYTGLQCILPGETAPAHRHTAFALRFIVEGEGGFTAVGGRKVRMRRGDVVLTPSWQWHDHGHEGDGPMIWLDGLDLPLYQAFPTNFAEMYSDSRYPSRPADDDADLRIGWDKAQAALDAQPGGHAVFHYAIDEAARPPRPLSRTLGGQAERVDGGCESAAIREACSFVYHCVRGQGTTRLVLADGAAQEVRWKQGDTFAVPAWSRRTHASVAERSYLFAVNDLPLLQNLGMYRCEGTP